MALIFVASALGLGVYYLSLWLIPVPSVPAETNRSPLSLSFRNPEHLAWSITNESGGVIQPVTYRFALFNLSQPLIQDGKPVDPLRIPVRRIDFINPGRSAGALLFSEDILRNIRVGDRLFGTADVYCPGCDEQSYWLYIQHGQNGWFAKMQGHSSRGLELPMGAIAANPEAELEKLVPSILRTPITSLEEGRSETGLDGGAMSLSGDDTRRLATVLERLEKELQAPSRRDASQAEVSLKARALSLSVEVLKFVGEVGSPPMPRYSSPETWEQGTQKLTQWYANVMHQYSLRFGARVIAMHDELKEYGVQDKELDMYYRNPTNPLGVQAVGEHICALANRIR